MANWQTSRGVPASSMGNGVQVAPSAAGRSGMVPAPPGLAPHVPVKCTATNKDGSPCKNDHLPEREVCFSHARYVNDDS